MISFTRGSEVFNYRAAGVAVDGEHVLLHRTDHEDWWIFPGGRVEMGETAAEALKREMREELSVKVEVLRPLWVVENFFKQAGNACHELSIYFLIELPPQLALRNAKSFRGIEPDLPGMELLFEWFPRRAEVLSSLPLLPTFLCSALEQLPETLQHVVHVDAPNASMKWLPSFNSGPLP